MILRSLFALLSLTILLLITACSSVPGKEIDQTTRVERYAAKSVAVAGVEQWALKGRLAINNGQDGGSGHLNWQNRGHGSSMNFHGPLGRGAWQLYSDENGAVLERADGEVNRADTVGELIEHRLGWEIPVNALAWWVRGLSAPGDWDTRQIDEQGNLDELNQFGWHIEFDRYRDVGNIAMPTKLTARRQSYTVKLVIQSWDLDE